MSFAVNVVGHYVLPWDWGNEPMTVRCSGRKRRGVTDLSLSATCSSDRSLVLEVDLTDLGVQGIDKVRTRLGGWFGGWLGVDGSVGGSIGWLADW